MLAKNSIFLEGHPQSLHFIWGNALKPSRSTARPTQRNSWGELLVCALTLLENIPLPSTCGQEGYLRESVALLCGDCGARKPQALCSNLHLSWTNGGGVYTVAFLSYWVVIFLRRKETRLDVKKRLRVQETGLGGLTLPNEDDADDSGLNGGHSTPSPSQITITGAL